MTARSTVCDRRPWLFALVSWIAFPLTSQNPGFDIFDGGSITMSVDLERGVPLSTFVKTAQELTGKEYRYKKGLLSDKNVSFTGVVKLTNHEFSLFAQTMIYRLGLECVSRGGGDKQSIEIVAIRGRAWSVAPLRQAQYVRAANLATMRNRSDLVIVTSVPVTHEPSIRVAEQLAKLAPRGVQIGRPIDGRSIILQGPGDAVYEASRIRAMRGTALSEIVPRDSCGAAEFDVPVRDALPRILEVALGKEWRDEMDRVFRRTGRYPNAAALITEFHACLAPRAEILLRPNKRSETTKKTFRVDSEKKCPQWAFVFRIRKDKSGQLMSAPFAKLCRVINENRRVFRITAAFKLGLSRRKKNTAFEFAMPHIPGTGCLSIAVVGDRFVVSNSGPFLYAMFTAVDSGRAPMGRRYRDAAKKADPARGLVWVDRRTMPALIQALGRKDSVEVLEQGELDRWVRLAFGN